MKYQVVLKLLLPLERIRIFGHFGPTKYWHFWPISSLAQPNYNANKVPRWFFRCVGTKTFAVSEKIWIFCPKTTKIGIFGHFGPGLAGYFGALLVGWLVVVARGLNLARHLLL